ncbi:MAG: hypothetical protein HY289_03315 [Planctomycetes bacterium]|nr:hypothetical protein [Planctomycetota bacterium]
MAREKQWVQSLLGRLQPALLACRAGDWRAEACAGERFTYAHEIYFYPKGSRGDTTSRQYETDLLIYDIRENGDWIPRLVIEGKLGGVSTHDALTYSSKAATHKHVHPYLRYGILIGAFDDAIPGRLIRHGAFFDFMMVWQTEEPSNKEWSEFVDVIADEVVASRTLQALLTENRIRGRKRFRLLHRPLRLNESK